MTCESCKKRPAVLGGWCEECNHTNHCAEHGFVGRTEAPEPCPYCGAQLMEQAQRCAYRGCVVPATKGVYKNVEAPGAGFRRTESYGIWCDEHHDWFVEQLAMEEAV